MTDQEGISKMETVDVEKEREKFEYWFSDNGANKKAIERRGEGYLLMQAQSAWGVWLAAKKQAMDEVDIASIVEGLAVSVDVSTGDHDSGNRYFGYIGEVMECETEPRGVILLVHDVEPNFDTRTLYAKKGE